MFWLPLLINLISLHQANGDSATRILTNLKRAASKVIYKDIGYETVKLDVIMTAHQACQNPTVPPFTDLLQSKLREEIIDGFGNQNKYIEHILSIPGTTKILQIKKGDDLQKTVALLGAKVSDQYAILAIESLASNRPFVKWVLEEEERLIADGLRSAPKLNVRCERVRLLPKTHHLLFHLATDDLPPFQNCKDVINNAEKHFRVCPDGNQQVFVRQYIFALDASLPILKQLQELAFEVENHRKIVVLRNVVTLLKVGKEIISTNNGEKGSITFVQTLAPGHALSDWILEPHLHRHELTANDAQVLKEKIPDTEAAKLRWEILKESFEGLKAIHDKQVMHGDITPSNIVVDLAKKGPHYQLNSLTIIDFGKARDVSNAEQAKMETDTHELFRSPDWELNGQVTTKNDIWTMGLVALRLYCGFEVQKQVSSPPMAAPHLIDYSVHEQIGLEEKKRGSKLTQAEKDAIDKKVRAGVITSKLTTTLRDVKRVNVPEVTNFKAHWSEHLDAARSQQCKQMPDKIYDLIKSCLEIDVIKRPDAAQVLKQLNGMSPQDYGLKQ